MAQEVEEFLKALKGDLVVGARPSSPLPLASQLPLMEAYLEAYHRRPPIDGEVLHLFYDWPEGFREETGAFSSALKRWLLPDSLQRMTGGVYLRWQQQGIVLNPGPHFLHYFHQAGFFIQDIDAVIVSNTRLENHADLQGIHALNYEQNRLHTPFHSIHYYLHPALYPSISAQLKPHFKQEGTILHSLDFYLDSPHEETLSLHNSIQLTYFPLHDSLGLRLECLHPSTPLSLGWWEYAPSPLPLPLRHCALLLCLCAKPPLADVPLLGESPPLVLCVGFEGKKGDFRLDSVRKMRDALGTSVFPAGKEWRLFLPQRQISCHHCHCAVESTSLHIVPNLSPFGPLVPLCSRCLFP